MVTKIFVPIAFAPQLWKRTLVSELFKTPDGARVKQDRLATIPLGRFGKPADIADLAVFLASDESPG